MCTGASPQKIAAKDSLVVPTAPGNECAVFSEDFFLEEIVFLEGNVLAFKKLSYFFGVNRMVAESRGKTKRLVAVVAKVNSAAQGF